MTKDVVEEPETVRSCEAARNTVSAPYGFEADKISALEAKNLSYERYEELVVQRDQLRKEARSIEIVYSKEFGDLITESFRAKIECIRLKKTIAKVTQAINRGETVDFGRINREIEHEMTAYGEQLKSMLANVVLAKQSVTSPDYVVEQVKRIYRRLAKMIHPDIYPTFDEDPRAQELWEEIEIAYAQNDLVTMQDLEIMVMLHIDEDEEKKPKLSFSELEERIGRLEREIDRIIHTQPYTYRELLEDEEVVEKKKQELSDELEEYRAYVKDLSNTLDGILDNMKGGAVWQMNL